MKNIIHYEWRKFLIQGKLLLFILILFLGQILLFWCDKIGSSLNGRVSYSSYVALVDDIRSGKVTEEEIKLWAESPEDIVCTYTDTQEKEYTLYRIMDKELQQIQQYPSYINNILHREDTFAAVGSNYHYAKEEKAEKDYANLAEVTPYFCGTYGISLLSGCDLSDFMVILILLLIAVGIIAQEREKNTDILLHCMAKGRKKTGAAKFLLGIFLAMISVLLVYAGRIFAVALSYGIGDWNAPVQSVLGFSSCIWQVSIGEYLIWYLILKVIAGVTVFSLCFLGVNLFLEAWKAFVVNIIGVGAFYFLYQNINGTSWLAVLKWYNPIAFFDSGRLFSEYHIVNLLNRPVCYSTICIFVCFLLISFLAVWNSYSFENSPMDVRNAPSPNRKPFRKVHVRMGIFVGELYKCFVCQKGFFLYCFVALIILLFVPPVEEHLTDMDAVYFRSYIKEAEGRYSDEKLNRLYAEKDKIIESEKQLELEGLTVEASQVLGQSVQRKKGLKRAIAYGEYLREQENVSFVYDVGYKEWMGMSQQTDTLFYMHILAVILVVVFSVSIWWVEESTGMAQLIRISAAGEAKLRGIKRKTVYVCSVLAWGMVFGLFAYQIGKEYGFLGLNASAKSILAFSGFSSWIKIWMVVLIIYLLKLLYLVMAGLGVRVVAEKGKGYLFTAVVSSILFLMPVLIIHVFTNIVI